MSYTEKSAWIMALIALVASVYYLSAMNPLTVDAANLRGADYGFLMGKIVIGWIVLSIALHIGAAIVSPGTSELKDERDQRIDHFGDRVGQYLTVAAAVGALAMAIMEMPYFYIAQTIFAGLVLGSLIGSVAKLVAYRWGIFSW